MRQFACTPYALKYDAVGTSTLLGNSPALRRSQYEQRAPVIVDAPTPKAAAEGAWGLFQNLDDERQAPDGGRSLSAGDIIFVAEIAKPLQGAFYHAAMLGMDDITARLEFSHDADVFDTILSKAEAARNKLTRVLCDEDWLEMAHGELCWLCGKIAGIDKERFLVAMPADWSGIVIEGHDPLLKSGATMTVIAKRTEDGLELAAPGAIKLTPPR